MTLESYYSIYIYSWTIFEKDNSDFDYVTSLLVLDLDGFRKLLYNMKDYFELNNFEKN